MGKLKELLERVPDKYDDFIQACLSEAEDNPEEGIELVKFLTENPDAKTDDVIDFMDDFEGISVEG